MALKLVISSLWICHTFCSLIKFSLDYLREGHFDRKSVPEFPPTNQSVTPLRFIWSCFHPLNMQIGFGNWAPASLGQNRKINVIQFLAPIFYRICLIWRSVCPRNGLQNLSSFWYVRVYLINFMNITTISNEYNSQVTNLSFALSIWWQIDYD